MVLFYLVYCIDRLVQQFFNHFNKHYEDALATDFTKMDLVTQMDFLKHIYKVHALYNISLMGDIVILIHNYCKAIIGLTVLILKINIVIIMVSHNYCLSKIIASPSYQLLMK